MKKFIFLWVAVWCMLAVYAQTPTGDVVIKGSNQITQELTPKQIIDSLKKRFPNAQAVQYYKTTPEAAKAGWVISEENDMFPGEDVDRYTLSFKRDDFKWYALYDADGNLLMSKYEEYGTALPEAVSTKLLAMAKEDQYKNYKLLSKTHFKQVNYGKAKDYYEITAIHKTDPSLKKFVTLAPDGTVLKVQ